LIILRLNIVRKIINFINRYKEQSYPGSNKDNLTRILFLLFRGKISLVYKAYFSKPFNSAKLDADIIKELNDTIPLNIERCLLDKINDIRVRAQVNFIAATIKQTKAQRVLETGTHKAMFCYVAHLCNEFITVDTFGNLPESQKSADVLNQKYGKYIKFYLGDSRQTLSGFSPSYQIDFAWIDGGHSFEVCFSDLINCARLGIPTILVDDYKWSESIRKVVDQFVTKYDYLIENISDVVDYRGIVHLTKFVGRIR